MKKFLYLLMAAALICSCEKNEELDAPILEKPIVEKEELTNGSLPESLYAYAAGNGDNQTRTVVSNEKVLWNKGDNIFYCTGQTIGAEYKYEGNDEVAKASFEKVGDGNRSEVMSTFPVGVFPYRDYFGAKFNVNKLDDETDDTWTITPDFEQFQNYVPNSFDKDANIMIAAGNGEDNNLSFRNACGYVVVSLYGTNVKVDNVQLHANYTNNASIPRICGKLYGIEVKPNGELTYGGNNLSYSPWQNMVELNCVNSENPQGVQISDDPNNPTEFWFALPPMVLKDGFFLRVEDSNGNIVGKNTDKSFEIERNKVKRMAAVDASNPKRTHRLWYKTTNTTYSRPLKKFDELEKWEDYFDAKIIAHTWDTNSPNGKGHKMFYIEFDRPLTEIKAGAFKDAGHSDDDELIEIILPETLTTIGESAFKNTGIKTLKITDKVTHIGQNAFADCEELTSVTFESITTGGQMTIGNGAFQKSGLTSISIPGKVTHIGQYAFANCETLTSVTIESGSMGELMTIGKGAFQYSGLTTITIPRKVVCIEQEAFADCESLATVTFESGSTPLTIGSTDQSVSGNHPFYNSNTITTLSLNRELVAARAGVSMALFEGHESLNSVTLGGEVKTISDSMFSGCSAISGIIIPETVTSIGKKAFYNCDALKTLEVSKGVQTIGESALAECDNLASLIVGGGVNKIEKDAFYNCPSLSSVTFKASPESKTLEIASSYDSGNSYSPFYFTNIKTFDLNREVDTYHGLLSHQDNLTSVTLGEQVKTLGVSMFFYSSLPSITIPNTVEKIGVDAFEGCENLKTVKFNDGAKPLEIGYMYSTYENTFDIWQRGPFYYSPLETIYLGRELIYKDADDKDFTPDEADEGIFYSGKYDNVEKVTVTIGENVKTIHPYMFNLLRVEKIDLPSGVKTIGSRAFEDCYKLKSITISGTVTSIGNNAFDDCTSLSSLTFEGGTENLVMGYCPNTDDVGPFYYSPLSYISLNREIVPSAEYKDELDYWDMGVFSNKFYDDDDVPATVELGEYVKTISDYMFTGVRLETITIPATVEKICYRAFYDCRKLYGVTLGFDGKLGFDRPSIGKDVFDDCSEFDYIKVRESVHERFITEDSDDEWYEYQDWITWDDNFK